MAEGALSIKLRCASWQQLATIYKRDLSHGTMFLRAATPPPVGTAVRIDLTLPSATVIVLDGTVGSHVQDPQRGAGVELTLAPIPASSIWLIESALASETKRLATPIRGVPIAAAHSLTGAIPIPTITENADVTAAEQDLIKALVSEADSLKKLNPFLVLGVGYEATDAEVRAAFGELTKRYHPDRFARYESAELRQVAAEIFILIRDAYRRLGDAAARGQVLATLGKAGPAPRAVPGPPRKTPSIPPPRATQKVPLLPAMPAVPPVPGAPGVPGATGAAGAAGSGPAVTGPAASSAHGTGVPTVTVPAPSGPPAPPAPTAPPPPSQSAPVSPVIRPPTESRRPPSRQPTADPVPSRIRPSAPPAAGATPGAATPAAQHAAAPARAARSTPASAPPGHGATPADRRAQLAAPHAQTQPAPLMIDPAEIAGLEDLIDQNRLDEALSGYRMMVKRHAGDRNVRAGVEVCEGLLALAARDRLEAAQRFETALEIDPSNERAARELAEMRRQATNERKGLLSRLMGKKEP